MYDASKKMSKTLKKHGFLKKIIISRDLKVLRHHNHRPYLTQINYEANEWNVIRFCLEQHNFLYIFSGLNLPDLLHKLHSALCLH